MSGMIEYLLPRDNKLLASGNKNQPTLTTFLEPSSLLDVRANNPAAQRNRTFYQKTEFFSCPLREVVGLL